MKIDWKEVAQSAGYKSLKAVVVQDCMDGQKCFNTGGCNHEYNRIVPQDNPGLAAMGFPKASRRVSKCFHRYCNIFKWIMGRAQHYSTHTGKSVADILNEWEAKRTYCYLNYYQDCNFPKLKKKGAAV